MLHAKFLINIMTFYHAGNETKFQKLFVSPSVLKNLSAIAASTIFHFISDEKFAAMVHTICTELLNFGFLGVEDFFAQTREQPCHLLSNLLAVELHVVRQLARDRQLCFCVMEILSEIN
jgi:hypothetical protein